MRSEAERDGGAWPIPTHGPQAGSSIRTPAVSRSTYVPRPRDLVEDLARAGRRGRRHEGLGDPLAAQHGADHSEVLVGEFTDEPMQTCKSSVPATSSTGATLPGLDGLATRGTSAARSMTSSSSKSPGVAGLERGEVLRALLLLEPTRVCSSEGKTAPVAPSSAIMFAIVPRSV